MSLPTSRRTLGAAVGGIVLLTVSAGLLHGRLTNRWNTNPIESAAARLPQIPTTFGAWELKDSEPLPAKALQLLQCAGYINRLYANKQTGDEVLATIVLGALEPVAGHDPASCYTFKNYSLLDPPQRLPVKGHDREYRFWGMTVQVGDVNAQRLRVLYAWGDGVSWAAPNDPRFHFGGRAFLYRVQVLHAVKNQPATADAVCRSFLQDFLPIVSGYTVDASVGLKLQAL